MLESGGVYPMASILRDGSLHLSYPKPHKSSGDQGMVESHCPVPLYRLNGGWMRRTPNRSVRSTYRKLLSLGENHIMTAGWSSEIEMSRINIQLKLKKQREQHNILLPPAPHCKVRIINTLSLYRAVWLEMYFQSSLTQQGWLPQGKEKKGTLISLHLLSVNSLKSHWKRAITSPASYQAAGRGAPALQMLLPWHQPCLCLRPDVVLVWQTSEPHDRTEN